MNEQKIGPLTQAFILCKKYNAKKLFVCLAYLAFLFSCNSGGGRSNNTNGSWKYCEHCDGEGRVFKECPECGGSGTISYISNTFKKDPCLYCGGDGQAICKTCHGTGVQTCPSCGGEGYLHCTVCDGCGIWYLGSESIECPQCDGSGWMKCVMCKGEGSFSCGSCGGDGESFCEACCGSGGDKVPVTSNGLYRCNECNGEGGFYVECDECDGEGKIWK